MSTHTYTPSYDNKIYRKYSIRTLESKPENKLSFQQELGWIRESKIPLLCLPGGMSDQQGGPVFRQVLEGILSLNCQLVVRGIGSSAFGELFTSLAKQAPHRVKILPDEDVTRRKMYAASDGALFFTVDPVELQNCLAYGAIPIGPKQPGLENYDPVQESGNAFLADPLTSWTWFAALVRACETYKLPYDWRTIQQHAMETVKENGAVSSER